MITLTETRALQSDQRLCHKTQDETLIRMAMAGAGLSRWEATELPKVVEEVYFSEGRRPWHEGLMRYQCVDINDGAGKALAACRLVTVVLTLIHIEEDREVLREHGAIALRRSKLTRIAEEAREQGGVLTQEDLGVLLGCDDRTVRRDISALKRKGIYVPTRGYLHDIGPTLSHKAQAIRHWLEGKEPVKIARAINHSLKAVERYLKDFRRVALLAMRALDRVTIARAANLSPALVETYVTMYSEAKDKAEYAYRFRELAALSDAQPTAPTAANGEKKGAL